MRINHLIGLPKFSINKIEHNNNNLKIFASFKSRRSQCPVCGSFSISVHDSYTRKLADLSVFQNSTTILLQTRKFKCKEPTCHRKVFSEQTPYTLRYSRRTVRVSNILKTLSIELTGKLGSLLSSQLLFPVSTSTVTRIALKQQLPVIIQPMVLGVDDWAFRKGVNYGTVLIDMVTSRPIELLKSREGADLKEWLTKYPDIKIVTRDRASSYSSAINEVCPGAIQVADRFHLLMNLSDALDKYFKSVSHEIRFVIKNKCKEYNNIPPDGTFGNVKEETDSKSSFVIHKTGKVCNDQRIDTFNKVKELQEKGIGSRRISRELRISRGTVRSYFIQESLSPRNSSRSTNFDVFTKHILVRLNTKGYKIKDIIEEILVLGFNGGKTQAYNNINLIKSEYKINIPDFTELLQTPIHYIKPLSSRKLSKYIGVCLNDINNTDERIYMETLLDNIPEFRIVRKLVQIFRTMLKKGCGNIKRWIDFIKRSKHKLSGLRTFANGLSWDIKAVENGIRLPWSNGTVEGHVNRIKSIKRQMYGRASFELLRRKVILSQTG